MRTGGTQLKITGANALLARGASARNNQLEVTRRKTIEKNNKFY